MIKRSWQVRDSWSPRLRGLKVGGIVPWVLLLITPSMVAGQVDFQTASESVHTIARGSTAIVSMPDTIIRALVGDEEIADISEVRGSPNTVLVTAKVVGSTNFMVWGRTGPARIFTIVVTADVASLQRQLDELFPEAGMRVTSTGTSIVLSGEVRDPSIVRKAIELAEAQGIPVVNNVDAPAPEQILLEVEFAEVSKSTLREVGGDLLRILNPQHLDQVFDEEDTHEIETLSEGFVTLFMEGDGARLDAVIRALKNTGEFRSLAKPNLVTREGQQGTFLAGGEFPFPTIQGGGNSSNAVTIEWREFGILLDFTPTITNSGNIRLHVAPEVSSLDFANGLTIEGFNIPSILARRVETDVELRPGQTLAIGGLLDNQILTDVDKIPILGDIPILGFFFRSEAARQDRTELLVLVTPHILDSDNLPVHALPTGDPEDWEWDRHIREWMDSRTTAGTVRSGGSGGS